MNKTKFKSQTKYAFWILACIQLPAPIILLMFKLASKKFENYCDIEQQQSQANQTEPQAESKERTFTFSLNYFKSLVQNIPVLQMTLLISLLVFFFEGLQVNHILIN